MGEMDFTAMRSGAFAVKSACAVYRYPGSQFLRFRCISHAEGTDVRKNKWPVNLRHNVGIMGKFRRHDPDYRNGDQVPFHFVLFPQV